MSGDPAQESRIRGEWAAGRFDDAATLAIEYYGSEIFTFLAARLRSSIEGREAFSIFAEDLWMGLAGFSWRCSMRTWAYTLARNAANRYATAPHRRAARNVALADSARLGELVGRIHSTTQVYQQTAVKNRMRELRERLDPDDQMLLILRVDRELAWRDLAMTMAGDPELDDVVIEREAARLRKSFERVKAQLRRMAEAEGLLKPED